MLRRIFIKTIINKRLPFAKMILFTSENVEFFDKVRYFGTSFLKLAPVIYILDNFTEWKSQNEQFNEFMWWILLLNMIVGIIFHVKNKTFDWKEFLIQNALMCFVVGVVLIILEMFRYTAGDNLAGEVFRVFTQTITLFYPASKILKNIFILSNGQYPPAFLIRRLYNFEKNGDLKAFFTTEKVEDEQSEDITQKVNELLNNKQ